MPTDIMAQFRLDGKVAVVTGARRGLGQGMAIGLAEAGAKVVALSTDVGNLTQTQKEISKLGRKVRGLTCNIADPAHIENAVNETLSEFGTVDILLNNAGTIRRAPAHEYSDEDWQIVLDVNLNGLFRFCRAVGKIMMEKKQGKIINIASLLSFSGGITVPAYAASKGAVAQLTKALANEWAQHKVQVNAIAPGYFETDTTCSFAFG